MSKTNTHPTETTTTEPTSTTTKQVTSKFKTKEEYIAMLPDDKKTNVSALIRLMANQPEFQKSDGKVDRSQIAKITGKIYQHVRNVLVTPVKKSA